MARKPTKRKRNADGTLAANPTNRIAESANDSSVDDAPMPVHEHDDEHDADYVPESEGEEGDGLEVVEDGESDREVSKVALPVQKKSRIGMKYAPKAGQQAERTVREHKAKADKDAAFNKEKGIPHRQTMLCFKKVPKQPSQPVAPKFIVIEDSESEQEIQCISPERQPIDTPEPSPNSHANDHDNDDAEFTIIEHWLTEREGEGANEELAIVLEDDDEDEEEENRGNAETEEDGENRDGGETDQSNPDNEESEDMAAMEAARALLMLHTPDEDALTELRDHDPDDNISDTVPITIDAALDTLNALLKGGKKKAPQHPAQLAPLMILRNFFILRQKGLRAIEASEKVASMWRQGQGVALARRIRYLSRYYLKFQSVPVETRGGMRASTSLLCVAEVERAVNAWLHQQPVGTVTPKKFRKVIVDDILPGHCGHLGKYTICERTARRWLKRCVFEPKPTKKGVYEDGHERVDVVEYREQVFLPRMAELERRAVVYEPTEEGQEGEWNVIQPTLAPGERRVVFYFHDESCFHQKDFQRVTWQHHSQQKITSKGLGRLIHVSDFVTNATPIGRLVHTDSRTGNVEDARVIIKPGSQGDAWWDTKQLVQQLARAIEIHDTIFGSDVEAVFVFDQSSAHNSMGEGALDSFDMNKSPGAKRKKPVFYKDTIVPDDVPNVALRGAVQEMMYHDGEKMQPKGTERILAERGIFPTAGARAKCNPRCYETNIDCCFARILHNQRDFKEQKCALETLLNEHGHSAVFLPKFHCECNPIEMFWGYSKYLYRQVVKHSLQDAEQEVLKAMSSCSGDIIRKYINRAFRFMDAYRKGLKGEAALWVVRKQKSHRRVSEAAMQALEARK